MDPGTFCFDDIVLNQSMNDIQISDRMALRDQSDDNGLVYFESDLSPFHPFQLLHDSVNIARCHMVFDQWFVRNLSLNSFVRSLNVRPHHIHMICIFVVNANPQHGVDEKMVFWTFDPMEYPQGILHGILLGFAIIGITRFGATIKVLDLFGGCVVVDVSETSDPEMFLIFS